jgi:polyhydroxyalkanoate synthesis regulator phasin
MAEPADQDGLRELAEQAVLAAVGAVSLTAERVDALADELAERGGLRRDEARALVRDVVTRWRGDTVRVTERAGSTLHTALRQLGLALREEVEDLELRVAQLEHRVRLLEGSPQRRPR